MTVMPITPDEIRHRPESVVNDCVKYINELLQLDVAVATLNGGGYWEVFDSSGAEAWKIGHAEAVEVFKQWGWQITQFESEKFGTVYRFSLPPVSEPQEARERLE